MSTFDTPHAIAATIDLAAGDLRVTASGRTDTHVSVTPRDPNSAGDVKEAEQAEVTYADGRLAVKTAQHKGFSKRGAVIVTVELPEGSRLEASSSQGNLYCEGRLGETSVHTTSGDVRVGEIVGDLFATTTKGNIDIDRALADVQAKTEYGDIRILDVVQGTVAADTAAGRLEIGVRQGTAARLDINATFGAVKNLLDAPDSVPSGKSVEVRASSGRGDIVIYRA